MKGTRVHYVVRALIRKGRITIRSMRNIKLLVAAVDFGLCRFVPAGNGHIVEDPHWNARFGVEVTDAGRAYVGG